MQQSRRPLCARGEVDDAIEQYVKLGELYRSDGLSVKAIAVYKKIAKLDPATSRPIRPAPISTGSKASSARPRSGCDRGGAFHQGRRHAKLTEAYRRLRNSILRTPRRLRSRPYLLLKADTPEEAAIEYDRAAQAAQAAGQAAEAKRLFQKARDLLPQAAEAIWAWRRCFAGKENLPRRSTFWKRSRPPSPKRQGVADVGRSAGAARAGAEAVTALQKAIALGTPEGGSPRPGAGPAPDRTGR